MNEKENIKQKQAKAYEKYAEKFTPNPSYLKNFLKAFAVGGLICTAGLLINNFLIKMDISDKAAGSYVTILMICIAQGLTGIGVFESLAKHVGAGVIVPITGFANSMVAPAIEYKKEGIVLGVGAKMFSIAGPVLVCGITTSAVIGIIYWIKYHIF